MVQQAGGRRETELLISSSLAVAGAGWLLWSLLANRSVVFSALVGAAVAFLLRIRPSHALRFTSLTSACAFLIPFGYSVVTGWPFFRELWNDPDNLPALVALTGWRFVVPALVTGIAVWIEFRLAARILGKRWGTR